jgi:hypothetical protein
MDKIEDEAVMLIYKDKVIIVPKMLKQTISQKINSIFLLEKVHVTHAESMGPCNKSVKLRLRPFKDSLLSILFIFWLNAQLFKDPWLCFLVRGGQYILLMDVRLCILPNVWLYAWRFKLCWQSSSSYDKDRNICNAWLDTDLLRSFLESEFNRFITWWT